MNKTKLMELIDNNVTYHTQPENVKMQFPTIREQIEFAIDNLDNWISVDTELPKNDADVDVLMFMDDGYIEVNYCSIGNYNDSEWTFFNGTKVSKVVGMAVTHWQPLPKPPKE